MTEKRGMTKCVSCNMTETERENLRYQMLVANECVAALDKAIFMGRQYTTEESIIAAVRGVRAEYARKRDDAMSKLHMVVDAQ